MIILKFDDMMYPFSQEWQRAYDMLLNFKIKACFGAVSDWCHKPIDIDHDLIEIWYHGKSHLFIEESGVSEFCGPSYAHQYANFTSGLSKLNELCPRKINTFGPALNKWDKSSMSIVEANKQIEKICFSASKIYSKICFTIKEHLNELWVPRRIVNGKKTGTNEFIDPSFYKRLDRMPLSIIPFHPGVGPWNENSFKNFELFLNYIKPKKLSIFRDVKNNESNKKLYL
jgi:hypothetical protein